MEQQEVLEEMTSLEILLSSTAVAVAIAGNLYVLKVVRSSGRDRPHDPERVQKLIENAPMELLEKVLDRQPE